jgi:hypothetical protein
MKTVYSSNRELVHIWANNDDSSVNKRAYSISCQFDRLYSYNTCIAEIVGDSVIFNNHSYSNSTSKHQSLARSAIHGKNKIWLDIPRYDLRSLRFTQGDFDELVVKSAHVKIGDLLVKAERARKNGDFYNAEAFNIAENIRLYAKLLDLNYEPLDLSQYQKTALEIDRARKAQEKIRKAERAKEQAEDLEKWRAGEDVRSYFEVTALRIKNDEIETSRGAKIPLEHAIRAYPILKRLHNGEAHDLGHHSIKLGHYTVNRVEKNDLIVGCHKIPFSEIYAMANQLNLGG